MDARKNGDTAAIAGMPKSSTVNDEISFAIDQHVREIARLVTLRDEASKRGVLHVPASDMQKFAFPQGRSF